MNDTTIIYDFKLDISSIRAIAAIAENDRHQRCFDDTPTGEPAMNVKQIFECQSPWISFFKGL